MRRTRVCIYGGTDLQGTPIEFVSTLAYEILNSMPAVIVTGGFRHSGERPEALSTDVAALKGAQKYAQDHNTSLKHCYEAWVPEPDLDGRMEVKGAVRLNDSDGITLKVLTGRTPLGRRLAMVADVDLVVTIAGRRHTEVVIEQALEQGLPVLPIPDAGGDSRVLLEKYRERIALGFAPGALDRCLQQVSKSIQADPKEAAAAVVNLMRTAKVGKCLMLLPYDLEHNTLYESVLRTSVAKHMLPIRLDELPSSEAISANFADAIRSSLAVVADVTVRNENVVYEVGYAHGHGLKPLIYTRDPSRLAQLPVYFRALNIRVVSSETQINCAIEEYLLAVKAARRVR